MVSRAALAQIRFILRRRSSSITFLILMAIMLSNYTVNVFTFQGYDVLDMYHPMKLLSLSYNHIYYSADTVIMLVQLFPLLVCLPAGLSLAAELQMGEDTLLIARVGGRVYYLAKLIAVFISTFIVFSLPFLLEILLNCLAFPLAATGDFTGWNIYQLELATNVRGYLFPSLYLLSPYLYAVLGTLLFGLTAGLLACFTTGLSAVIRVKYRVVFLLPAFLLLHGTTALSGYKQIRWYNFLLLFDEEARSAVFGIGAFFLLTAVALLCMAAGGRKDCLR